MTKKCSHKRLRVSSVIGNRTKIVSCKTCGKHQEVPFTTEEKRLWRERNDDKGIHVLYWAYQDAFYRHKKGQLSHCGFKYKGYKMMRQIEKFAKEHPEVVVCSCDDSYNAGSMIVFIPHRSNTEYWGTTVVNIPQCTREDPLEMFLYPGHAREIEKTLHGFHREFRQKKQAKAWWPKP